MKKIVKKVTKYVTDDNTEFDSAARAGLYESMLPFLGDMSFSFTREHLFDFVNAIRSDNVENISKNIRKLKREILNPVGGTDGHGD